MQVRQHRRGTAFHRCGSIVYHPLQSIDTFFAVAEGFSDLCAQARAGRQLVRNRRRREPVPHVQGAFSPNQSGISDASCAGIRGIAGQRRFRPCRDTRIPVCSLFPHQRYSNFNGTSSGVLSLLAAFSCTLIGRFQILFHCPHPPHKASCAIPEINTDGQGLNPANLESVLSNWETTYPGKRFPKLLYTIPSGSNPTGASIPEHRKIEVFVPILLLSARIINGTERMLQAQAR
jgi:hypothetical protein